ncbi:hypothetical protein B0G71_7922 [Paraburkholderia sp. BL27I4N3]|nr:hypothetical protein B0G71_7922 [Paraburkholderia sp. BL27I4N3]
MKQATLEKLQVAVRDGQYRLFYFDEAGFCGSPPVQRSWSPRGLSHAIEPNRLISKRRQFTPIVGRRPAESNQSEFLIAPKLGLSLLNGRR